MLIDALDEDVLAIDINARIWIKFQRTDAKASFVLIDWSVILP